MRTTIRPLTRSQLRNDIHGWNMNRFFNEVFGQPVFQASEEATQCSSWSPAVNILEKEDGLTITVELPGLDADDVEVTVEDSVLSMRGERRLDEVKDGETYHRVEASYGTFERRFNMPESVDTDNILATFRNGVMTLSLPKSEESKPKSIKIKVDAN